MPFRLKNAGATYQILVNQMFANLMGKKMEVYVDEILVKSLHVDQHVKHSEETFEILRRYQMKLNPKKCAFRMSFGKFLEFMVYNRGIEANPKKIKAVLEVKSPTTVKEV